MRRHVSAVGCSFVITNTTFGAVFSADTGKTNQGEKKKTYNKCKERFSKLKLNNAIRKVWSSV